MPRVYFTGRRDIPKRNIEIRLLNGTPPCFKAIVNLERYRKHLPEDALVIIEARTKVHLQRFSFGTVAEPRHTEEPVLTDFDPSDRPTFRIKICGTGEQHGMLLAGCDAITAREDDEAEGEGGHSLLPVCMKPDSKMGGELWCLQRAPEYQLWVNEDVIDLRRRVRARDPFALGMMIPAALREIIRTERMDPDGDAVGGEDGQAWIAFAELLNSEPWPEGDAEASDALRQEQLGWIDNAVRKFCRDRGRFLELINARLDEEDRT